MLRQDIAGKLMVLMICFDDYIFLRPPLEDTVAKVVSLSLTLETAVKMHHD